MMGQTPSRSLHTFEVEVQLLITASAVLMVTLD
jgi:hypothetical protein